MVSLPRGSLTHESYAIVSLEELNFAVQETCQAKMMPGRGPVEPSPPLLQASPLGLWDIMKPAKEEGRGGSWQGQEGALY